jgi:hypothetical protein
MNAPKAIFDSKYPSGGLLIMSISVVICTALLIFLLYHIKDHPIVFSLLSLFLLRTILDAKVEKMIVEEDRFVILTRRLLPFMNKQQVYLFEAIESIYTCPPEKGTILFVRTRDGNERLLNPAIYPADFQKALAIIGHASHISIVVKDLAA